jgi:uncharacterized protein
MLRCMTAEVTPSGAGRPTTTAAWALREAQRIVREEIGTTAAQVVLFGSWAKGCADRLSDIDIGVLPLTTTGPELLGSIRERLEESDIPFHIDVVDLSEVDEAFRTRVFNEGELWIG